MLFTVLCRFYYSLCFSWIWGLGFIYIISSSPLKAALFSFSHYTLFIYKDIFILFFHIEIAIRNVLKGGKPNRKPYNPYGFRYPYKTINQKMKKTQVFVEWQNEG
jgi:hypothetical protein